MATQPHNFAQLINELRQKPDTPLTYPMVMIQVIATTESSTPQSVIDAVKRDTGRPSEQKLESCPVSSSDNNVEFNDYEAVIFSPEGTI